MLVGRILAHRLDLAVPPPISQVFAKDIGGYLSGLTLYRQGQPDPWVSWFAEAVRQAADRTESVLLAVRDLEGEWQAKVEGLRSDAAARALVLHLTSHPVLSAKTAAELLEVSPQTALVALVALADRGVLQEADRTTSGIGQGRPTRWWVANDLLNLLGR